MKVFKAKFFFKTRMLQLLLHWKHSYSVIGGRAGKGLKPFLCPGTEQIQGMLSLAYSFLS